MGTNIQHVSGVDKLVANMQIIIQSAINNQDEPITTSAVCCMDKRFSSRRNSVDEFFFPWYLLLLHRKEQIYPINVCVCSGLRVPDAHSLILTRRSGIPMTRDKCKRQQAKDRHKGSPIQSTDRTFSWLACVTRDLGLTYYNTMRVDHYPVVWESATARGPYTFMFSPFEISQDFKSVGSNWRPDHEIYLNNICEFQS